MARGGSILEECAPEEKAGSGDKNGRPDGEDESSEDQSGVEEVGAFHDFGSGWHPPSFQLRALIVERAACSKLVVRSFQKGRAGSGLGAVTRPD